jgi:Flp pilus assembly protein protease CpaA
LIEIIFALPTLCCLCAAAIQDLKTSEVSNSLMFASLTIPIILYLSVSNIWSLAIGMAALGVGYAMVKSRAWGMADAFSMSAALAAMPTMVVGSILYMILTGYVYVLVYFIINAARSDKFWETFFKFEVDGGIRLVPIFPIALAWSMIAVVIYL